MASCINGLWLAAMLLLAREAASQSTLGYYRFPAIYGNNAWRSLTDLMRLRAGPCRPDRRYNCCLRKPEPLGWGKDRRIAAAGGGREGMTGKQIVFDRFRQNSDIVLIDLPGGPQKP
jgi:hypothetical protein